MPGLTSLHNVASTYQSMGRSGSTQKKKPVTQTDPGQRMMGLWNQHLNNIIYLIQHTKTQTHPKTRLGQSHALAKCTLKKEKKKPHNTTSRRIHTHPVSHQITNHLATVTIIQYTVTANNQPPHALPGRILQQHNHHASTCPTAGRHKHSVQMNTWVV